MEILIAILFTWYSTKAYYTKSLILSMKQADPDMVHATCSKCSQIIYTHVSNLRAPYYCLNCK